MSEYFYAPNISITYKWKAYADYLLVVNCKLQNENEYITEGK